MSAAATDPKAENEALDAEEIRKRIYATDWTALRRKLYKYAFTLTKGDHALASDLAQDVIEKEWDPRTRKWNPKDFPDFAEHCKARLFGLWRDRAKSRDAKYATSYDPQDENEVLAIASSRGASPEKLVSMADGFRAVFAALRAEATKRGDHVVLEMLDLKEKNGTTLPRDFAEELNMPIEAVYDAMRRIGRIEEHVAEEFGWESIRDRVVGAPPMPEGAEAARMGPPPPPAAAWPWRWGWLLAQADRLTRCHAHRTRRLESCVRSRSARRGLRRTAAGHLCLRPRRPPGRRRTL